MTEADSAVEELENLPETVVAEEELPQVATEVVEKVKAVKKKRKKKKTEIAPVDTKNERLARLQQFAADLRAKNPKLRIGLGSDPDMMERMTIRYTPTGLIGLDPLLGGGFPNRKFTVLYGPSQSGKSALAILALISYMERNPDKLAIIVDAENSVDRKWFRLLGFKDEWWDRVIYIPGDGPLEDLANLALWTIQQLEDEVGFFLIDSLGAMVPAIEVEGKKSTKDKLDMRTDEVATAARKISKLMRLTGPTIARHDVTAVLIAHVYVNINAHGMLTMKGGSALKHFSHLTLKIHRKKHNSFEKIMAGPNGEEHKVQTGFFSYITVEKTKVSSFDGRTIAFPFKVGIGFDTPRALLNSAVGYGVIVKSGAWYKYGDASIGQGADNTAEMLGKGENQLLRIEIENKLMDAMREDGLLDVTAEIEDLPVRGDEEL